MGILLELNSFAFILYVYVDVVFKRIEYSLILVSSIIHKLSEKTLLQNFIQAWHISKYIMYERVLYTCEHL